MVKRQEARREVEEIRRPNGEGKERRRERKLKRE